MSINLPIEGLMSMVQGVPPGLFVAVAFVMSLQAILQAARALMGLVMGFAIFYLAMTHPAVVNSALAMIVSGATQLLRG
jgi:hypothetical protein